MKFRVWTNDGSCIDHFSNLLATISGLAKNCVLRITKSSLNFIIRERSLQGGTEAWCELETPSLFSESVCDGLSAEQDEILLEVVPEQILHCLRSGTISAAGAGSCTAIGSLASTAASAVLASGIARATPGSTSMNTTVLARSLKIKLVRRKTPCLALELEQASVTGRSRPVWHFIPVHILPPRLWPDFEDIPDPEFDLSIFLPPVRNLRLFVDRMKRFARFITVRANGAGDLYLEINMETLARVRLTYHGLRARNWHQELDKNNSRAVDVGATVELPSATEFSATVDIRRLSQLLSSQRIQPNWFVCNIVNEHLLQFVLLFESARLKYTLPASRL
nr:unnamed protein product [Spirometra erinaceieuropaei]